MGCQSSLLQLTRTRTTGNKMELIDASQKGDLSKVQELIADLEGKCLDVNYQDDDRRYTALIWACRNNQREIVLALLSVERLHVNLQSTFYGNTALMLACMYNQSDIALDLLLDRRVDRHMVNYFGQTALMKARRKNLSTVATRIEKMDRGDDRMPMLLVHHRYIYASPDDTNNGLHPYPASAIAQALVISGIVELICRYIA